MRCLQCKDGTLKLAKYEVKKRKAHIILPLKKAYYNAIVAAIGRYFNE